MLEREILRVRDQLHTLANVVQGIAVQHAETKTVMDNLAVTLEGVCDTVKTVPDIDRRISILERLVFGAIALVLVAFVGALISGVIKTS